MSEIYTANDLIRFIYNETSAEENVHIEHLISHNAEAKEEYEQLKEVLTKMDDVSLNANPTSVQIIMEHSLRNTKELI